MSYACNSQQGPAINVTLQYASLCMVRAPEPRSSLRSGLRMVSFLGGQSPQTPGGSLRSGLRTIANLA
jgi:hypothetical protein